jgi:hypothetical protein
MKRLVDGEGSELERGLLEALRLERPSPELEQRMRAAIGLGPPAAPAAPEPAAPPDAAIPAAKTAAWGSVAAGAVAAAVVAGGIFFSTNGGSPTPAAAPVAPRPAATPKSEPAAPRPASATAPNVRVDEPPTEQPAPKARPQAAARSAPTTASLREEIRLIDSARVAVKNNDGARALGLLEQYARRFPDGSFKQEAGVLRAEALKTR